ncbi:MAG TPA: hypothetical protein ENJ37_00530 [Deltaproteobacteria bacterium]|nr:hypothetical protein [Deltaproteobacteria bacterium]
MTNSAPTIATALLTALFCAAVSLEAGCGNENGLNISPPTPSADSTSADTTSPGDSGGTSTSGTSTSGTSTSGTSTSPSTTAATSNGTSTATPQQGTGSGGSVIVSGGGGSGGGGISGGSGSVSGGGGSSSSATLTWSPPVTNTDGSSLTNLEGYMVYYGTRSRDYTAVVDVSNVTTYTVRGLTSGTTYFFTVTAYNSAGRESAYSNELYKVIP